MKQATRRLQRTAEQIDHEAFILHRVIADIHQGVDAHSLLPALTDALTGLQQIERDLRVQAYEQRAADVGRAYSSGTVRNLR